jgi:pyruvate formate lyase activating enzyme
MNKHEGRPLIFDIKHFAIDDGPGIRTTVFMKGCPLACPWCHNPESIESGSEIAFIAHLCIDCGNCQTVCPEDAVCAEGADRIVRDKCTRCQKCVDDCPTTALRSIGEYYSIAELVEILKSDHFFYETSRGGVTFSGGEPTLYMDYVGEVMKELKSNHINIAIQTSGMFELSEFKSKLLPYVDMIFYDIKFIDPVQHRKYTGRENSRILKNFLELARDPNVEVIPRVPLIPEITTVTENLVDIADFLTRAGCTNCQMLPFNSGGKSKRSSIGKPTTPRSSKLMSTIQKEEEWRKTFADHFNRILRTKAGKLVEAVR